MYAYCISAVDDGDGWLGHQAHNDLFPDQYAVPYLPLSTRSITW